jgi:diguanylate cyclase (GGDEF)-like protein
MALAPLAIIAMLHALPAANPASAGLAWIQPAGAVALAIAGVAAAVVALVGGLRRGALGEILIAGSSSALAGGALVLLADGELGPAVLGATLSLAGAVLLPDAGVRNGALVRVTALVVLGTAEAAALLGLLPGAAALAAPVAWAALGLGAVAVLTSGGERVGWVAALVTAGAGGVLADRGGSVEGTIGLTALVASQLVWIAWGSAGPVTAAEAPEENGLPALAERLHDAVLRFDGGLRLRDWNRAAASLLGLEQASLGTRAEELLGVTVAELPSDESMVVTRGAIGGLEVAMHRSGGGVVAVIRDPGAAPEAERLGQELRATIEELLRARRTIDLQRGELERSATVDPLTGVASRAAILERLRLEVSEARRYRHPLAIVLLDVDHFGAINAEHGIAGGDAVLREVALRFRLRVREADAIGRFGGDGFIAALPHTDAAGAATFADALRHRLQLRPVVVDEAPVRVTVSVGVATVPAGEDIDLDGLLARVDEALASARSAGGDRIALDRLHGFARLEDPHPPAEDLAQDG